MANVRDAEIVARVAFAGEWEQLAHTTRVVGILSDELVEVTTILRPILAGPATESLQVAWLHDVVEDTVVGLDDLRDIGFSEVVLEAVRLLTRGPRGGLLDHDYETYIDRLALADGPASDIARAVKWADATDNLRRCVEAEGVPKWARLTSRYRRTLAIFAGAVEGLCTNPSDGG